MGHPGTEYTACECSRTTRGLPDQVVVADAGELAGRCTHRLGDVRVGEALAILRAGRTVNLTPRAAAVAGMLAGGGRDRRLAELVACGRLALVRAPPVKIRYGWSNVERAEPLPPELPPAEIPKTEHWLEIELVDDLGNAVPNERYRVTLPDGRVREGRLNAQGRARMEDVPPGVCEVGFPDIDAAEWGPL